MDDCIKTYNKKIFLSGTVPRINNAFKFCPIRTKTLSPKNANKPWIIDEICQNIKKRQSY